MSSIRIRLALAFGAVGLVTSAAALILALVYFERRLAGMSPDLSAQVQRQLTSTGGNFDGLAELTAVVGVSLAAGLLTALLLARRFTTTLRSLTDAARRVAGGDLNARATARAGRDELGQLVTNFNTMAIALQALDHERAATSAAIAHELRTPLAALTARLQALHDGVLTHDKAEIVRLLHHTGILRRLVDDLRTLSLADAGRLRLDLRVTDLRATVADAIDAHHPLAVTQRVALTLGDIPAEPVPARVDPNRIAQILANLLDNAVRHTPPDGTITVTLSLHDDHARITVDDTGPGIPEAERSRVFDRFTQLDPARRSHGTGLGLAIVHTLVTAHDGTIAIDDAPCGGARVDVCLPLTRTPRQHA